MKIKSFKSFLIEALDRAWIQSAYNEFKSTLESRYRELYPDQKFKVTDTNHIIDQVVKRSSPPEVNTDEPTNIPITEDELKHIFEVLIDRFFRPAPEGIVSVKSPEGVYKVNDHGEWEFQHKIFMTDKKNFRCIIYAVRLGVETKLNKKGVKYLAVVGLPEFKFITILPSGREGKDNPKYKNTNGLTESLNLSTINEIED